MGNKLDPIHPGKMLAEEFIKPMNLTQSRVAREVGLPPRVVNGIVRGHRPINAEAALRLSRYFGNTPQFWLGLQADYDLDVARKNLGKRIKREVKVLPPKGLR